MILQISPACLQFFMLYRAQNVNSSDLILFLDTILARMRSGLGFRESFCISIRKKPFHTKNILKEWEKIILMDLPIASAPRLEKDFLAELVTVDKNKHRAIDYLVFLRKKLRSEVSVREKFDAAMMQTHAQAAVTGVLYISLIAFYLFTQPTMLLSGVFLISLILFGLGLVGLVLIKRSFKWKV